MLREAPLEAAVGAAAKGRFSPARPSWTRTIGLSREEELLCRRRAAGMGVFGVWDSVWGCLVGTLARHLQCLSQN